jgi:zinc/manganese transport system ATP-binding protein
VRRRTAARSRAISRSVDPRSPTSGSAAGTWWPAPSTAIAGACRSSAPRVGARSPGRWRRSRPKSWRLLLAQALLGRPRLLLLDEPLISLDPHYQQSVVELVRRVQRSLGMTVLFTAHEINPLLGAMDRVLYLGRGRAMLGTVDEVMTGEVLSRLYDTPIDVLRVKGRIIVVASHGEVEADAHRHDA